MSGELEFKRWLASPALSETERRELTAITDDADEINARFFAPLPFGTAGLRGICGVGINRMNRHIVRWTTQAFAEVLVENGGGEVVICFDSRHDSCAFSRCAAEVFAANGLRVRIFDDIRPTPELSFAVRRYGCAAGINITASHNTSEYNGYKLYGRDGAQLPTDDSARVAARMAQLDIFDSVRSIDYDDAVARGLIAEIGAETDEDYLAAVLDETTAPQEVSDVSDDLVVVYTPFHGAGRKLVPEALTRLGVRHLHCVAEQMRPDGNFPTVASPNPEIPESFELAVALAERVGASLIIGTDPDSDRIAALVRNGAEYVHLSGHKTGVLMLDYILTARKRVGRLPQNPVALKTIVTTDMARVVAEYHGAQCYSTFTGFKYMAERKREIEEIGCGTVVFSYEESFGYMLSDTVRDKDAVAAAVVITEMAAHYQKRGMTLLDALDALYARHGHYAEEAVSLVMPGLDGFFAMQTLMKNLRSEPPHEIEGVRVVATHDYEPEGSNVLRFDMEDGTAILIRPSGTEPKIKAYILAHSERNAQKAQSDDCAATALRAEKYARWAKNLPPAASE